MRPPGPLLQQGALAYGMKVDDRWRVLPNAKLRTSCELCLLALPACFGSLALLCSSLASS